MLRHKKIITSDNLKNLASQVSSENDSTSGMWHDFIARKPVIVIGTRELFQVHYPQVFFVHIDLRDIRQPLLWERASRVLVQLTPRPSNLSWTYKLNTGERLHEDLGQLLQVVAEREARLEVVIERPDFDVAPYRSIIDASSHVWIIGESTMPLQNGEFISIPTTRIPSLDSLFS